MRKGHVRDAVDDLFVHCIASADSLKAFRRAAALVQRLALVPACEHFSHLAAALHEQTRVLTRTNHLQRMSLHARSRDRELDAFFEALQRNAERSRRH